MCLIEIIGLIKDVATTGAAITAIYVGLKGLTAWKKQLIGRSEYELSRRILKNIIVFRDAIQDVRYPVILPHETYISEEESEGLSAEKIRYSGLSKAYIARFEKVRKIKENIYPDQCEGEIFWGERFVGLMDNLMNLERELFKNVRSYLTASNPDEEEGMRNAAENFLRDSRDIRYDYSQTDINDEFKNDLDNNLNSLKDFLKSKLIG